MTTNIPICGVSKVTETLPGVKKPQVIVISGPTAVGKSALALELAKRLNGEIISCDSVQVYKGLDIGSAKTPVAERGGIAHHLLDIKEPTEEYTAGDFYRDARDVTEDVLRRGKLPVVVGGTGLYLRWYIHGTPQTPKAAPDLAAEIEAKVESFKQRESGWDEAVAYLTEAGDPKTGAELARNDWYRMRRALEIVLASGKPKSEFQLNFVKTPHRAPSKKQKRKRAVDATQSVPESEGPLDGQNHDRDQSPSSSLPKFETFEAASDPNASHDESPSANPSIDFPSNKTSEEDVTATNGNNASSSGRELDYDFRCYFLFGPRRELYRRIDERCEQMVVGGLLQEASDLLDRGVRADTCMPSRAIGYRQALEYLEESRNGGLGGEERFLRFLDDFQQASRKYAKRQLTWFRSEGSFLWLDASQSTAELANRIGSELEVDSGSLDAKKGLIPDSWLSREQERELRSYRTERKIFCSEAEVSKVLAWVDETQRGRPIGTVEKAPQAPASDVPKRPDEVRQALTSVVS